MLGRQRAVNDKEELYETGRSTDATVQLARELTARGEEHVHIITVSHAGHEDPLWYQLYHDDPEATGHHRLSRMIVADVLLPDAPTVQISLKDTANALLHATDNQLYLQHKARFLFPWTPDADALEQLQQTLRRIQQHKQDEFCAVSTDLVVLKERPELTLFGIAWTLSDNTGATIDTRGQNIADQTDIVTRGADWKIQPMGIAMPPKTLPEKNTVTVTGGTSNDLETINAAANIVVQAIDQLRD